MARKEIVTVHDDLDESITEHVETINFGLDGETYEIDLGPDNQGALRDGLAKYVAAARKIPKRKRKDKK